MDFKLREGNPLRVKSSVLMLARFEGDGLMNIVKKVDESLGGSLSRISQEEKFNGELGKCVMLNTLGRIGAERVLLVGLGKKGRFSPDVLRRAGILAAKKTKPYSGNISIGLDIGGHNGNVSALIEGFMLGSYEFDKYKSGNKKENSNRVIELFSNKIGERGFKRELEFARIISEATNFARDLVNEPPAVITPTKLADIAEEIAEEEKLGCEIFDRKDMEEMGMGALLAVSSGSDEPPKFIHLTYEPKRRSGKTVAIVGKGITFDSGGLCIKPRDNMRTMKMDMSGAAVVLAVMKVISRLKPSVRVHGLISATENMPGGKAYKPDDIVRALNGKTIEVIDTDAEGRIVLSDALSYAVQLKADEIVDLATLTGACIVALGGYTAGIMGNNDRLMNKVIKASRLAGEKVWQLPLDDELRKDIESDIADVKNVGGRWGGAITAAMFLEKFVGDTPWVHLDIAGPAFNEKGGDLYPKGATGFGVRTMIRYILD
ncbi:MAG TPA: leucyl aminopeptidase [Thermodesulfobacteriota bacterium]|nr:leucyl aminopeptidase [Thermodesulfobacteriota bacterium]